MNTDMRALLFDLDGTVYRGTDPVPGAVDFINELAGRGIRALFVTNRANRSAAAVADHLRDLGIACDGDDVITSAEVAATAVRGKKVFMIGEPALAEALRRCDVTLCDRGQAIDAVVMGFDRAINLEKCITATRAVLEGAELIATTPDVLVNREDGVTPGNGAFVSIIETATGKAAKVMGKPHRAIVELALQRAGVSAAEAVMIGDNLATDIAAGASAGLRTALILTGVSGRADADSFTPAPTWVVADYEALSEALLPR